MTPSASRVSGIAVSELEVRESEVLALPNGVVVSLQEPRECAIALDDLRQLEQRVKEAKRILSDAIAEESKRQGSKTLHFDGVDAEVKTSQRLVWDVERLEKGLRELGMPEERIRTIITETVTYDVKAVEANRAARANPEYADLVGSCRTEIETNPSIAVRRASPR